MASPFLVSDHMGVAASGQSGITVRVDPASLHRCRRDDGRVRDEPTPPQEPEHQPERARREAPRLAGCVQRLQHLGDERLVDAGPVERSGLHPRAQARQAPHVVRDRVIGVAPLRQAADQLRRASGQRPRHAHPHDCSIDTSSARGHPAEKALWPSAGLSGIDHGDHLIEGRPARPRAMRQRKRAYRQRRARAQRLVAERDEARRLLRRKLQWARHAVVLRRDPDALLALVAELYPELEKLRKEVSKLRVQVRQTHALPR